MLKLLACIVLIFAAFVVGCLIMAAIVYGMCSLAEYFNKKGYHG